MFFLENVANEISAKADEWGKFAIICPNKRTIDYIKHYLAKIVKRTIWSPKFMNLSEFFAMFSDFDRTDDLVLNIELFKTFKKLTADSAFFKDYDFERFQGIGEIILKDFNEIDNYLVDVRQIFANISDYEKIDYIDEVLTDEQKNALKEFLGFYSADKLSEEKEYFLELWSKIPEIYDDFTEKLIKQKFAYSGLIIRKIHEKLEEGKLDFSAYDKYIFVGFNALTKGQKVIIKDLQKSGKALFFWDYDNYYKQNDDNEAGLFIRQNIQYFSDDLKIDRDNFLKQKNIHLIGFPLEIAQTKAIPTLLRKLNINPADKRQLATTAIVMPDEQLLFPVLHSLPPEIQRVNVTVGFPFINTSIFSLLNKWLKLLQKFAIDTTILIPDILKFFENQLLREILDLSYDKILTEIKNFKILNVAVDDLYNLDNQIVKLLFSPENILTPDVLIENILKILEVVFRTVAADKRTVETEAVYQFYTQMLNIQALMVNELEADKELITIRTLIKYLIRQLASTHIPFTGKSLDGLQVMTLMETRNIDFENIIFINLNENIIPHKPSRSSLISEFMRKSYGLPILKYQDSIFAYLFYRLLQRSKNIILTYSNLISDKSAELSRFVQQLMYETDLIKPEKHLQYSEKINPLPPSEIRIEKSDEIYEKLSEYLNNKQKLLSASSLNTYISCPLKFYFKYIAKIKPVEQAESYEIDAIQFGEIFHRSAEELLQPFVNEKITEEILNTIDKKVEDVVVKHIIEITGGNKETLHTGINSILAKIISIHLRNMLKYEKKRTPFVVKGIERRYYGKVDFLLDDKPVFVAVWGIFDRIDEKDNVAYIVDYKTGRVRMSLSDIDVLFSSESDYQLKGYFQMLLYSLIYKQNVGSKSFIPQIYLIDKVREQYDASLYFDKMQVNNTSKLMDIFEEKLQALLSELFDKETAFVQTENPANCKYCEFKGICQR